MHSLESKAWIPGGIIFACPVTVYALDCHEQLRYGTHALSDVGRIFSLVWGSAGIILVAALWFAAILVWIQNSRRGARATTGLLLMIAAFVASFIRLVIGANYFCERSLVNEVAQIGWEKGIAVLLGIWMIGIPFVVLGALIQNGAAKLLPASLQSAAQSRGLRCCVPSGAISIALTFAFVLFGWAPHVAMVGSFLVGMAMTLERPSGEQTAAVASLTFDFSKRICTVMVVATISAVLFSQFVR